MSMRKTITLAAIVIMMGLVAATSIRAQAEDPYLQPDETWISISGTAVAPGADSFILDYGENTVLVEMDDWDSYGDAWPIMDGDKVTVYGRIDDDFFEITSIEASSVYVEDSGTYYYANSADEEYNEDYDYWIIGTPLIIGQTIVRGEVTSVSGREFTIDTGTRKLTVDTILMDYNPLDDYGFQKVEKGDYVSTIGQMDYDFWEKRELMADSIIVLKED